MRRREFIAGLGGAVASSAAAAAFGLLAARAQHNRVRALQLQILHLQAVGAAYAISTFIREIESQLGSIAQLPWPAGIIDQQIFVDLRLMPAIRRLSLLDSAGRLHATSVERVVMPPFPDEIGADYCFIGAGDIDRVRPGAAELVGLAPDVIFLIGGPAFDAAQQETKTIPIVFADAGDPLETGRVKNTAHPEGNATGFANAFGSLGRKWVQLLKEAAPNVSRLLYLPTRGNGGIICAQSRRQHKRSRWNSSQFPRSMRLA